MRIKLDENLPDRLVSVLSALGHDADTVVGEGLSGKPDAELWPEVQKAERFLLTKDLGFSDERVYPPGTHHGILVLRLSDDRSSAAAERLGAVFRTEADHKVRIRLPQPRR
jgi:predicted nuclease of predicted toxin-antitoxin system